MPPSKARSKRKTSPSPSLRNVTKRRAAKEAAKKISRNISERDGGWESEEIALEGDGSVDSSLSSKEEEEEEEENKEKEISNVSKTKKHQPKSIYARRKKMWSEWLEHLEAYKREHGDCNVPRWYLTKNRDQLGVWVHDQRRAQKAEKLPLERKQKLDGIGFLWRGSRGDARWNEWFQHLVTYKKEHGNCDVPRGYLTKNRHQLGVWAYRQGTAQKAETLSLERKQKLDGIGFWRVSRGDARWNEWFQHLVTYKEEHGDCNVPQGYLTKNRKQLGLWAYKQRTAQKAEKLSLERKQKLDGIGFWQASRGDKGWNEWFQHLVTYKKEHGDCNVTRGYLTKNRKQLGMWVANQRRAQKAQKLSSESKRKLDGIGFLWGASRGDCWNKQFQLLEAFKAEHGHCNVPWKYSANGVNLGTWVANQRNRKGRLSAERILTLEEIGFQWVVGKGNGGACAFNPDNEGTEPPGQKRDGARSAALETPADSRTIEESTGIGVNEEVEGGHLMEEGRVKCPFEEDIAEEGCTSNEVIMPPPLRLLPDVAAAGAGPELCEGLVTEKGVMPEESGTAPSPAEAVGETEAASVVDLTQNGDSENGDELTPLQKSCFDFMMGAIKEVVKVKKERVTTAERIATEAIKAKEAAKAEAAKAKQMVDIAKEGEMAAVEEKNAAQGVVKVQKERVTTAERIATEAIKAKEAAKAEAAEAKRMAEIAREGERAAVEEKNAAQGRLDARKRERKKLSRRLQYQKKKYHQTCSLVQHLLGLDKKDANEGECLICCEEYQEEFRSKIVCRAENSCCFEMCRLCVFRRSTILKNPVALDDEAGYKVVNYDPTECPNCKEKDAFRDDLEQPLPDEVRMSEEAKIWEKRETHPRASQPGRAEL